MARARNRRRVDPGPKAPPGALRHGLTLAALWALAPSDSAPPAWPAGATSRRVNRSGSPRSGWSARRAPRPPRSRPSRRSSRRPPARRRPRRAGAGRGATPGWPPSRSRAGLPPALEIAVTERARGAGRPRRPLPGRPRRAGLQAGRPRRRARPAGGDRPRRARTYATRRDEAAERRCEAALALLDRWREAGLDRRAAGLGGPPRPRSGGTVYAGDDGMEIRLGQGDLPRQAGAARTRALARSRRTGAGRGDPPRQPAPPGLGGGAAVGGRRGVVDGRGPRGP